MGALGWGWGGGDSVNKCGRFVTQWLTSIEKKTSKMKAFICNSYILDLNGHFKDYNIILFSRFILSIINQAELIKVFFF